MNYKKALFTLSSSTLIAQTFSILLIPFISRIYSTTAFAEFAYWASIGGLLGGVITLKQEQFILSRPKAEWGMVFARIYFLYVIFILLSTITIATLFAFNAYKEISSIALVLIYGVATSLIISLSNIASIEGKFKGLAKARIYMSLSLGSLQIGLGIFNGTSNSLLIGTIGSQLTFLTFLYFDIKHHLPKSNFKELSFPSTREISNCTAALGSTITLSIATSFPPVLLLSLGFEHEAGVIALLQRFLLLPVTLMAMPLSQIFVFFLGQLGKQVLSKNFLILSAAFTFGVYMIFYIVAIAIQKISLLTFILGKSWSDADILAPSITAIYASILLRNISNQYFLVREKQSTLLKFDLLFITTMALWYINCSLNKASFDSSILQLNLAYISYATLPIISIILNNFHYTNTEPA
jgi:hypothetical protein